MLDPNTVKLMQIQHEERLAAAQQARKQAQWQREPGIFARLFAARLTHQQAHNEVVLCQKQEA